MKKMIFGLLVIVVICSFTSCLSLLFGESEPDPSTLYKGQYEQKTLDDLADVYYTSDKEHKYTVESKIKYQEGKVFLLDDNGNTVNWKSSNFTTKGAIAISMPEVVGYNSEYSRLSDVSKKNIENSYSAEINPASLYRVNFRIFNIAARDPSVELIEIESLPSIQEYISEAIAKENAEKEEAKRLADERRKQEQAERARVRDEKAKTLANGYTYHGVGEDDQNASLFDSGALEDGHAYYISGFMVNSGGNTAGVTTQTFLGRLGDPNSYHMIEYTSQKVRGEVVSAGNTILGELPVSVVVAGGKPPFRVPIVLGLIE